ncbi:oxidoreductase [Nocardia sp. NPDC050697]|uniref:oxidoreductase n=1 Tax=Nocardia sp. NPDC050697 TaxID=3155158 RepID=UPI0033FD6CA0
MGLLDRLRGAAARAGRSARRGGVRAEDARYLAEWVRTHTGVEGYVEPKTTVTDVTVVLIAADGEWTRRVVGERGARSLAGDLRIPVYDVARTGYPQRMRDHDERERIRRRHELERELDEL